MKSYKRSRYDTPEEFVLKNIEKGGKVFYQFQVAPYDHKVKERTSPIIYLTEKRLLLFYDDNLEVYELKDLKFSFSGERPVFKVWKSILETGLKYSNDDEDDYRRMKEDEFRFRFSIIENNKASKDFLFRNYDRIQRTYQTWSMGRIIMNHQEKKEVNQSLLEMVNGDFIVFNQRAVLIFAVVTTIYFLMRWLLLPSVPDLMGNIVDILFVVILAFMAVWLYLSYEKNLKRYEKIYLSYTIEDPKEQNNVTNQVN